MRSRRRWIFPLSLVAVGIILLIGCIPVPATRQLQPDWRPRPEHAVGIGADKPVRLGHTSVDDAFVELSRRVGATVTFDSGWMVSERDKIDPKWSIAHWSVSPDYRTFAVRYQIRKTNWIMPLCFHVATETEDRWLVLAVDENRIITGATVSAQKPPNTKIPEPADWLNVFDESQRRKLQEAGVFPEDDALRQAQQPYDSATRSRPSSSTR